MQRTIGGALRALRLQNKLSVKEIADRCHISKQAWSNYEHDTRHPDVDKLDDIARQFNVSLDYLTGATNLGYDPRDPEFKELMGNFLDMDNAQKKALLNVANKLRRK